MTTEDIRREYSDKPQGKSADEDLKIQMLTEIAAQLAELNEKFADYFQTLEPTETDTKRGIR